MAAPGLIVAAPHSGSGKTVVTLGLLRALAERGVQVRAAKVGPDYIDPAFLSAASRGPAPNLDSWAMRPGTIASRIAALSGAQLVVCEGVMGLFDGAPAAPDESDGSTAEIAARTGWPVVLVIDAARQAGSAAALLQGFVQHRADVAVAGVVFNRVNGASHRAMIEQACATSLPGFPILGWLPRDAALALPERHLGLIQARETEALDHRIALIAGIIAKHIDLDALRNLARPATIRTADPGPPIAPLGQRIAVARDEAFAFAYPEVLEGWRTAGAELSFFSPLADQAPARDADSIYLPGGYPELHATRLAAAQNFLGGLRETAQAGAAILGECGGAMALGESLEDAAGATHAMAALLPLATSFKTRKLHLGYRRCALLRDTPLGKAGAAFRAHEFHYATTIHVNGPALFHASDARGTSLGEMGLIQGRVMGSFLHLIDRA